MIFDLSKQYKSDCVASNFPAKQPKKVFRLSRFPFPSNFFPANNFPNFPAEPKKVQFSRRTTGDNLYIFYYI